MEPETPHQLANRLSRENKALRRVLVALVEELGTRRIKIKNTDAYLEATRLVWGRYSLNERGDADNG